MYKMMAGMGDTIFTPLYQVLCRRGVKFKFFHKVTGLAPSADGTSVDTITLERQADVKGGAEYQPLVTVKDLPCWPSEPLYDQLEQGEALKALYQRYQTTLESSWLPWQGEPVTLSRGADFDLVVLGISIGALPALCGDLIARKPAWQQMIEAVETNRTQAFQVWLTPTVAQLGWRWSQQPPVVGGYVEPLDTWADMSQLIEREDWPAEYPVGNISYFCGPMPDDPQQPPYADHPEYPATQAQLVKDLALGFLRTDAAHLWPATRGGSDPASGFDWSLLVDPRGNRGEARFDSQFWRVNIDPTERYVLSLPGTARLRLRPDQSGFDNLYLAGDWTFNLMNSGCVEAAVTSGMAASRAICGWPQQIIGEPSASNP